jgi:hypothetical protein
MPMGVLKSVCELASLGDLASEAALALATGNNARFPPGRRHRPTSWSAMRRPPRGPPTR